MSFDATAYQKRVVDPARKDKTIPADLCERYAMDDAALRGAEAFDARVAEVVKFWRALKQKITYANTSTALLAAHSALEKAGQLTPEHFRGQRETVRAEAAGKVDALLTGLAAGGPCVTEAMVDALAASLRGVADRGAVVVALGRHKLRLVTPGWKLPDRPPVGSAATLRANLAQLGLRLSAELVLDEGTVRAGFQLRDGFRAKAGAAVSAARAEQVRKDWENRANDERKTAAMNVLGTVLPVLRDGSGGGYQALICWETAEALRELATAGLPAPALTSQAVELGLVRDEAEELAVLVLDLARAGGGQPSGGPLDEVVEAIAQRRLRTARQLLVEVPASDERADAERRVNEALARAEQLARQGDQAFRTRRFEDAAASFAQVLEIVTDDEDLAARLRGIAPPPPTDLTVTALDGKVTVRWTPSAARTGNVGYRVVRSRGTAVPGPDGGERLEELTANSTVDVAPPVGEPVRYSVFAARTEGIWSAAVSSAPVLLVPDVAELALTAEEHLVRGTWRPHPKADGIVVTRRQSGDRAETEVRAGRDAFTDGDVRPGVTYEYTVRATYLGRGGTRQTAPGVAATARPQRPARPVTDLAVELPSSGAYAGRVVAVWTPPPVGTVEIRLGGKPPVWEPGAQVPAARAGQLGSPQPGTPERRPDGRMMLPLAASRGYLTPVSTVPSGAAVAVGNTVPLAFIDPVGGLAADRFGDLARLRWEWPAGIGHARVEWWPAGARSGRGNHPITIGLRRYQDDGGAQITVGPAAVTVGVRALARIDGIETLSPAVTIDVPGRAVKVSYTVAVKRKSVLVTLTAEQDCDLPTLVVVGRADGILPLNRSSGTSLGTLPASRAPGGQPLVLKLDAAWKNAGGLACFVDAANPGTSPVTLVRLRGTR
ncbi:fibronectin type III domain-containing protein [Pseudofrankia asymbiotica]|uniref:Fibronectin type-III domain-containing protein n=1 Tax=Pseudofrankia asymbiotica TaxID=1834516 RepID=A0A1V2I3F0_9ACTN|nr:fibronectin type III domain-containing protein [Pseudofrankia asymbiotica]ONH24751.1 hypothetical protein BL253_29440 [Pseudofrankia asymbiotica]